MAKISINDLRPADLALELKGSAKVESSSSSRLTYAELTQVKGGGGFAGINWALSLIDWALRDLERRSKKGVS